MDQLSLEQFIGSFVSSSFSGDESRVSVTRNLEKRKRLSKSHFARLEAIAAHHVSVARLAFSLAELVSVLRIARGNPNAMSAAFEMAKQIEESHMQHFGISMFAGMQFEDESHPELKELTKDLQASRWRLKDLERELDSAKSGGDDDLIEIIQGEIAEVSNDMETLNVLITNYDERYASKVLKDAGWSHWINGSNVNGEQVWWNQDDSLLMTQSEALKRTLSAENR